MRVWGVGIEKNWTIYFEGRRVQARPRAGRDKGRLWQYSGKKTNRLLVLGLIDVVYDN